MIMYILQLGVITNFLNDGMISGLICGCGLLVGSSQISDILGIDLPFRDGALSFVYVSIFKLPTGEGMSEKEVSSTYMDLRERFSFYI